MKGSDGESSAKYFLYIFLYLLSMHRRYILLYVWSAPNLHLESGAREFGTGALMLSVQCGVFPLYFVMYT